MHRRSRRTTAAAAGTALAVAFGLGLAVAPTASAAGGIDCATLSNVMTNGGMIDLDTDTTLEDCSLTANGDVKLTVSGRVSITGEAGKAALTISDGATVTITGPGDVTLIGGAGPHGDSESPGGDGGAGIVVESGGTLDASVELYAMGGQGGEGGYYANGGQAGAGIENAGLVRATGSSFSVSGGTGGRAGSTPPPGLRRGGAALVNSGFVREPELNAGSGGVGIDNSAEGVLVVPAGGPLNARGGDSGDYASPTTAPSTVGLDSSVTFHGSYPPACTGAELADSFRVYTGELGSAVDALPSGWPGECSGYTFQAWRLHGVDGEDWSKSDGPTLESDDELFAAWVEADDSTTSSTDPTTTTTTSGTTTTSTTTPTTTPSTTASTTTSTSTASTSTVSPSTSTGTSTTGAQLVVRDPAGNVMEADEAPVLQHLQELTITVNGLQPNSDYPLFMHSTPIRVGTLHTDALGNGTATVTIPKDLAVGAHTLVVTDQSGTTVAERPFVLEQAAVTEPLAETGIPATLLTVLGLLLLTGGGAFVFSARRRSSEATHL